MRPSLIEKLRAMEQADESPYEAAIARGKLAAMGAGDRIPPQRPPAAPAPNPEPDGWTGWVSFTGNTSTTTGSMGFHVTFSNWTVKGND